jgi:hypothetical protein
LGFSLFWTIATSVSLPISRQKLGLGFIKISLTCLYV